MISPSSRPRPYPHEIFRGSVRDQITSLVKQRASDQALVRLWMPPHIGAPEKNNPVSVTMLVTTAVFSTGTF
jgi:hypothetical protein